MTKKVREKRIPILLLSSRRPNPTACIYFTMNADQFYRSTKWLKKREHILKRDGYQDQLEKRAGKRVPAEVVHHIFPREQYPEYQWDDWNLISISRETHRSLHLYSGILSPLGEMLKKETAKKHNVKYCERILVVGLPGSGKTTWAKANLKDGLCYDLDYIAGAFRLKEPKAEDQRQARLLANSMVRAFAVKAERYTNRIIIIRTAPGIDELTDLEPDKIVWCQREGYKMKDTKKIKERLSECLAWAKENHIEIISPPGYPEVQ